MTTKKRFKIVFPETEKEDPEKLCKTIKARLKDTADGILAKIMIFIYEYEPCTISELTAQMSKFYRFPYQRTNIYSYVYSLVNMGLVYFISSSKTYAPKLNEILTAIKQKHEDFLQNIPAHFQTRFKEINYYSSTEFAEQFMPWCSEIAGFKVEEDKKLKGGKDGDI